MAYTKSGSVSAGAERGTYPLPVRVLAMAFACSFGAGGLPLGLSPPVQGEELLVAPRSREEILRDGRLVLLTFPHQESRFISTDLSKGPMPKLGTADHFKGIDVDLIRAFADHLNVELWIRPVSKPSYGSLIPDLLAGKGDLIASSISITEERRRHVVFSIPYYTVRSAVVTRPHSSLKTIDDLFGAVGLVASGTNHEERLRLLGIPTSRIKTVDFTIASYAHLLEGQGDYVLANSTSALIAVNDYPGLEIAFHLPFEDDYAVALPPGSELKEPLDRFLARIKSDGRLDEIIKRHLSADMGSEKGPDSR